MMSSNSSLASFAMVAAPSLTFLRDCELVRPSTNAVAASCPDWKFCLKFHPLSMAAPMACPAACASSLMFFH